MKLAVIASHPVQYQAPLFRKLTRYEGLEVKVFYAFLPDRKMQGEGFGMDFEWDVPVLDGYAHQIFAQESAMGFHAFKLSDAFQRLRRQLSQFFPDAILCTGWHYPSLFAGIAAAVSIRKPCLLRCEANLLRPRTPAVRLFHRVMLSFYKAVLPIGLANRRYYQDFGIRPAMLFPSPYFIENERFSTIAARADYPALRMRWRIPPEAFCFLFSGKLVKKKTPTDIVEAVRTLPGAHLFIVGSGELECQVRTAAEQHGIGCSFAGFLNQSEMPLAYAVSDCLVLPSDADETWGLVVNEAMACGLPALVSDRVGCREDLIIEGETGFSFPCGNISVLATKMQNLANAPELAKQMGRNAHAHIQSYSVESAAAGVMRAMHAVCIGKTP